MMKTHCFLFYQYQEILLLTKVAGETAVFNNIFNSNTLLFVQVTIDTLHNPK